MVTKKKVSKKRTTKAKAPVVNLADKQTAETAITARKRRHAGLID